jgi:pterin-4a-carbinolamine dehydratase
MWKERESPLRIEKRFEFDQYSKISKFIGEIEKLCKERDIYPNISFGKNFVSLTIFLDNKVLSEKEKNFSKDIDNDYDFKVRVLERV